MRHANILAVAIVPALLLAGCGGRQDVARNAITQGIITGSAYKQELIAHLISRPETKTTMTVEECDRIARLIVADRAIAYEVSGLTQADRDAIATRYAALPSGAEYAAQRKKADEPKPQIKTEAAETPKPDPAAIATAAYAALPVIDPRPAVAALLATGTAAQAVAGGWKPVTLPPASFDAAPAAVVDDLTGLYISADDRHLVAFGPKSMVVSHDGGETWTRRPIGVRRAVAENSGIIIALTTDGAMVNGDGFVFAEDLPRAYDMVVGWGQLVIMTKSTLQWLRVTGTDITVAGKAPRPADAILAGATKDGAAIVVGRGCVTTALLPGGTTGRVPPLVGAARAAVAKPASDHLPAWVVPTTTSSGEGMECVDGAIYAAAPGGPASYLHPGDLLLSAGEVQFVVDAKAAGHVNDWSAAAGTAGRTYGLSKASAGLPAGTRAVEPAGGTLFAVGKHGLFRCPRW